MNHVKKYKKYQLWLESHSILMIFIASFLFALIGLWIGMQQSVWFDEAYSIMVANTSIGQLINLTAVDTHPPLYYIVLKLWASIFGWSELALRSLSVIASASAVFVGLLLIRRLFDVRSALITIPFVMLAPFLLRYAFEIRMYALASLICISATFVLILAIESKNKMRQWILYSIYAVLVAIGVYTLYYTVLLWLAHFVYLVWLTKKNKQACIRSPWLLAYAGSIVLFLPWMPTFISQISNGALAPISQPLTVENLLGIVSFQFLYRPFWQLDAIWSLVFIALISGLIYLGIKAKKKKKKPEKKYILLLLAYFLIPIIILTIVSIFRPMYVERYLAHVSIAMILLSAVIVAIANRNGKLITRLLSIAVFSILFAGTVRLVEVGNFNFQRLQTPQIDSAVASIDCSDGQTVLAADPYVAIELSFYLSDSCDMRFFSETAELSGGYAPLSNSPKRVFDPASELSGIDKITYVYYGEPKLNMPVDLSQVSTLSFDSLNVDSYQSKDR